MSAGAENTATFAIDFDTQGAKAGADGATGALEKLHKQIDEDSAALGRLQKAMKQLQGGTSVNIQAFQNLKKQIEGKKNAIATATANYTSLGGTFKKGKKPIDDNADAFKTLFERMQKGGGPIGGLAGRLSALRGLLAGGGALVVGAVAFVAALIAIAGAAAMAAAALLKYGLAAADAYRSERLQLEGLTKVRNWYGLAAGKAEDLQAAIDNVSGSSSLGREQINGFAAGLYKANMRGAALEQALAGVATATAVAGEEQGAFYRSLYLGAARSGVAINKISDDIKARFGGVAKAQMLSLTVQARKLKESFDALFRGLKIEAFLGTLKMVTDLFSQNTESGKALKQLLEIALQPLIDGFTEAGPLAKRFFQGAILAAQELTIAYYNVRLWLQKTFGDIGIKTNIDLMTVALEAGKFALIFMAVSLTIVMGLLAALAAPFVLLALKIYNFVSAVYGAGKALGEIEWRSLGTALVDGFVNGISAGIIRVTKAVKSLGKAALEALREALDSHSPSRKGLSLGVTFPQGVAVGIRKDLPLVQKASERIGAAVKFGAESRMPDGGASTPFDPGAGMTPQIAPSPAPARASGGGAPSLNLTIPITVEAGAAMTAEELEPMLRRLVDEKIEPAVRNLLESVHVSTGAAA